MDLTLHEHAQRLARSLLTDHPVLPAYADHVTILVVGSLGSGFADEFSDVDLWVMCADEVADSIGSEFREAGLRFDQLPPEVINTGGVEAHYFTFPISTFQHGLDIQDDATLFFAANGILLHDANGQFAALRERYTDLPEELVRDKVGVAYSRVIQIAFRMRKELRRFQPLCWLQNAHDIIKWALKLCCWLDGQAPVYSSWVAKQAQTCSTASIILPAVSEVMRSVGPAIEKGLSEMNCGDSLLEAADALQLAAGQAVRSRGFGDVPVWSPEDMLA